MSKEEGEEVAELEKKDTGHWILGEGVLSWAMLEIDTFCAVSCSSLLYTL